MIQNIHESDYGLINVNAYSGFGQHTIKHFFLWVYHNNVILTISPQTSLRKQILIFLSGYTVDQNQWYKKTQVLLYLSASRLKHISLFGYF